MQSDLSTRVYIDVSVADLALFNRCLFCFYMRWKLECVMHMSKAPNLNTGDFLHITTQDQGKDL